MYDPMSFWMQSTLIWVRIIKQQQDMYMGMLGKLAEKVPHENAAALAREAEAMRKIQKTDAANVSRKPARKAPEEPAALVTA